MDYLDQLNPQQRQAVTAGTGQVLVLAGPGSGKTRVLTHRIAYLIQGMGIHPYHILAVTFTNKAAREMEHRLQSLLEGQSESIWMGTFHGICARILRREVEYLPLKSDFVIMDSDDQLVLVKRAIEDLRLDDKLYKANKVHAAISTAKNNLIRPNDYAIASYKDEIYKRIYIRYQELLIANNAVDFDDLMMMAVDLFQNNPSVLQRYSTRFEHILVDEFQDTNQTQYELLRLLCSYHHNIFVVGDEDQSIYRWRGADYRNILRFEDDYKQTQKILLEQNYRSTDMIVSAARAVIDRNPHRTPKRLFSNRTGEEWDKIIRYDAPDDRSEATYVVDTIRQYQSMGTPGSDFAIMYRTNAQSRLLEEAFLRAGLPYRLVGAQRFYGRKEVKDMICYLRLAQNPNDLVSLTRVINTPARGIGDKSFASLQLAAHQAGRSSGDILMDLGKYGKDSVYFSTFSGRSAITLADFGALLSEWHAKKDSLPLPALFDKITHDIAYQEYLVEEDMEKEKEKRGEGRWDNVQELRRIAYEYQDRGLTSFLENLALVSDQDTVPEQATSPTLLTLHAAKGLEFNQVFIIGLDEGVLPHSRAKDEPEEMEEERRLFYVGLTRARNRLYLVRANRRAIYGAPEDQVPSNFLRDIPDMFLIYKGERFSSTRRADSSRWESNDSYGSGSRRSYHFGDDDSDDSYSRYDDEKPRSRSESRTTRPASSPARHPKVEAAVQNHQASTHWDGNAPRLDGKNTAHTPQDVENWLDQIKKPKPPATPMYQANQKVKHPVWGIGLIVSTKFEDNEELLEVFFESVGTKRLLATMAKLEVLAS